MNCVEITSLPNILFSHVYKADHYHNSFSIKDSFLEVSYIADGSLELEAKNEKLCATKGDIICFFHNKKTSIKTDQFHVHHTIGVRADWVFSSGEHGLFLPTITPADTNTANICHLIDDFVHNQVLYKESKALGAAKFLELLCAIDKCNRAAQNKNLPGELLYAERAKDYIQRNIHACITQNSVAGYLGISPEYLCTVFKKAEGTTVIKYINKLKLENIKTLIDNTNIHLYEAAAMYGYTDPNYVSRLHKQLFGYNITDKPHVHPEIE